MKTNVQGWALTTSLCHTAVCMSMLKSISMLTMMRQQVRFEQKSKDWQNWNATKAEAKDCAVILLLDWLAASCNWLTVLGQQLVMFTVYAFKSILSNCCTILLLCIFFLKEKFYFACTYLNAGLQERKQQER